VRVLAISDEIDRRLSVSRLRALGADLVVSCGDLPFDYLEFIMGAVNKPLYFVPGNHDPEVNRVRDPFRMSGFAGGPMVRIPEHEAIWESGPGPQGGTNLDGRVVEHNGLRIAGLGGSIRYRPDSPNQYTEKEMNRRVRRLLRRTRRPWYRRRLPVHLLVTHSPPRGIGDALDNAHRGFEAFGRLIETLEPRYMIHGHIHPHGFEKPDRTIGDTVVANVIPHRLLEVET
jgi:Icc-related predicted phosphoesterase